MIETYKPILPNMKWFIHDNPLDYFIARWGCQWAFVVVEAIEVTVNGEFQNLHSILIMFLTLWPM